MLATPLGKMAPHVRKKSQNENPNILVKEKCKHTVRSKVLNPPKLCKVRIEIPLLPCLWNCSFHLDKVFLFHTLFLLTVLSKAKC
jgi:hypothetical protein